MNDFGLLPERQRLKFGVQRAALVTVLGLSVGGAFALITWACWFPDYALGSAGKLLAIRGQASVDARNKLAADREAILVNVGRLISRDDDPDSYQGKKTRLAALQPFFDQAHAERTAPRQELSFDATSPATLAQDPISGRGLVLNSTANGAMDPKILMDFNGQRESIAALVALANQRSRLETPVDSRAIVERDLAELRGK